MSAIVSITIILGILLLISLIIGMIKKSFATARIIIILFAVYIIWSYLVSKGLFHLNVENFFKNII